MLVTPALEHRHVDESTPARAVLAASAAALCAQAWALRMGVVRGGRRKLGLVRDGAVGDDGREMRAMLLAIVARDRRHLWLAMLQPHDRRLGLEVSQLRDRGGRRV